MISPEEARDYLRHALPEGEWAEASRAIRKNHAYIQQYIRTGKPRWLKEADREALVALYGLDADRLRQPLTHLPRREDAGRVRHDQRQINAPRLRKVVEDPDTLELLAVWDGITDATQRMMALRILRAMVPAAPGGITNVA